MLKAKIKQGTKSYDIRIPTSSSDVSVKLFKRLITFYTDEEAVKDEVGFISCLLDMDRNVVKQIDPSYLNLVYENITFINDGYFDKMEHLKVSRTAEIGGVIHKIPKDIELQTLGQFVYCKQVIEANEQKYKSISEVVAVYMFEAIKGKPFDEDEIEPVIELIEGESIETIYPLYNFFLINYLMQSGNYHKLTRLIVRKRLMQG